MKIRIKSIFLLILSVMVFTACGNKIDYENILDESLPYNGKRLDSGIWSVCENGRYDKFIIIRENGSGELISYNDGSQSPVIILTDSTQKAWVYYNNETEATEYSVRSSDGISVSFTSEDTETVLNYVSRYTAVDILTDDDLRKMTYDSFCASNPDNDTLLNVSIDNEDMGYSVVTYTDENKDILAQYRVNRFTKEFLDIRG